MKTGCAILSHESAAAVERMLDFWCQTIPADSLFLLYGGNEAEFERIQHPVAKAFLSGPQLRVKRPRQDHQSFTEIFQHLASHPPGFDFWYFAEYDLLPLVPVSALLEAGTEAILQEKADALFPLLYQVDGTCQEIYLQYAPEPRFLNYWKEVSVREDAETVFWALFPGALFSRDAVTAIASHPEPYPMYFEIYLPTLLHHLGYRLRPWSDVRLFIHGGGNHHSRLEHLRYEGKIAAHPVKGYWSK